MSVSSIFVFCFHIYPAWNPETDIQEVLKLKSFSEPRLIVFVNKKEKFADGSRLGGKGKLTKVELIACKTTLAR